MVLLDPLVSFLLRLVALSMLAVRFCQRLLNAFARTLSRVIGHGPIVVPRLLLVLVNHFGVCLECLAVLAN